jgi:hypothetical protein
MAQTLKIHTSALLVLAVLVSLFQYPVRTLVADVLFTIASRELDDKTTDMFYVLDITEETLPAYRIAIEHIRQASLWDPGNSLYPKTLSDLHTRIGTWAEVIGQVSGDLPEGVIAWREEQGRTKNLLAKAIDLEPSNPDYHFALYSSKLASLQADKKNTIQSLTLNVQQEVKSEQSVKPESFMTDDLEKAIQLYPNSSPLRYAVALQYLVIGAKNKALEHAKALASRDDSYRRPDTTGSAASMERRSAGYLSFLAQSYLTKAFEIAWRASDNDLAQIRVMTPPGQEAKDTENIFLETKMISVIDGPN